MLRLRQAHPVTPRLALGSALLALLALGAVAPPVLADAASDARAVYLDWQPDKVITACRFTRAQLVNAQTTAASSPDFDTYAPGFRDQINREIARYDSGGCQGISTPPSAAKRARSPLRKVRIAKIRPKGGSAESVTIRNAGSKTVSLRGATLRDRKGNRVRFPRGTKLRGKRSLKVITGCAPGQRRPVRRGSRLFACKRKLLWDDRGDVVKLADSRGTVVAQRGYGRLRKIAHF